MPPSTRQAGSQGQDRRQERSSWQREQRDDLTFSEARHVLWERRLLVVGCTLFFLAVALIYVLSREPVYTAEATLSVRSEELGAAENVDEILSGLQDSAARPRIVEEAADRVGWRTGDFEERLEREQANNGEVRVRFSAPTPEGAAQGANAYAQVFVERVEELEGRLAGGTVAVSAEVEEAAEPPERRSGLEALLPAVAAAAGGLLVGGITALFLEGRAHRWRGSKDAELTLRAPVLGVIPDYSDDLSEGSLSRDGPSRDGDAR